MLNNFEHAFREGLLELLYVDPNLGAIARRLGMPVVDNSISQASLKWDKQQKKIVFAVNEEFVENTDEDMLAGIILHETEHLIFDHISERIENNFPNKKVLHMAQECINNDIIDKIYQLPLPDDAITGKELLNIDCTALSTKQVYDLIMSKVPPQDEGGNAPGQSERQKGQSGSQGSGSGNEGNGDDEDDEDDKDNSQKEKSGCGGIQVDEDDILDVEDYLKDVIGKAAADQSKTYDEMMDEINNTKRGEYSPTGSMIDGQKNVTSTRMNWNRLLAKINPKVLESGKKTKIKYDWTKQNRKLISVYPKAIVPKVKTKDPKANDKGEGLPVLVIALDLSGSISRDLVAMLQGLLNDIPEKLITAYPCTWGTYLHPYVPGGPLGSGGTNIMGVVSYVQKIQEETKTNPYVLVITDGQFPLDFPRPGKDWYFMAVDDISYRRECVDHAKDRDHLYHVKDFKA